MLRQRGSGLPIAVFSGRSMLGSSSCVSIPWILCQWSRAALSMRRVAVGMLSALCAGAEGCIERLWRECKRQPRCVFQIWHSRMEQGQVSQKQAALAEALAEGLRRAQEQQQDAQRGITEPGEGRHSHLLAGICLGQLLLSRMATCRHLCQSTWQQRKWRAGRVSLGVPADWKMQPA